FEKMFEHTLTKNQLTDLLSHPVVKEIPFLFPKRKALLAGIKKLDDTFIIQGSVEYWTIASFSYDVQETTSILKKYKCSKKTRKTILIIVREVIVSKDSGNLTDEQLYLLKNNGIHAACKLLSILLRKKL